MSIRSTATLVDVLKSAGKMIDEDVLDSALKLVAALEAQLDVEMFDETAEIIVACEVVEQALDDAADVYNEDDEDEDDDDDDDFDDDDETEEKV